MNNSPAVRPELNQEISELGAMKKGTGSLVITSVAGFALTLVLLFTTDIYIACLAGLLTLAYDIFIGRRGRRKLAARLTASQAMLGTGSFIEGCTYQRKSALPADILQKLSLSDRTEWPVKPVCRHSLSGRYKGMEIRICECSVGVKFGKRKGDIDFLSGTLLTADGISAQIQDVIVITEGLSVLTSGGCEFSRQGYVSSDEYAGKTGGSFCLYRRGNAPAPKWLVKAAEKLFSKGYHNFAISCAGGQLAVFVRNSYFAPKYSSGTSATESFLKENQMPYRDTVLNMLDAAAPGSR